MRPQLQRPTAQFDLRSIADQHRGLNDGTDVASSKHFLESLAVVLAALRQRVRQLSVRHESRFVLQKCARAEDVIRVHVRHQHVANRQLSQVPDAATQPLTVVQTAAAVEHSDAVSPNDESDVCDGVLVLHGGDLIGPTADVDPARDLRGLKRVALISAATQPGRTAQTEPAKHGVPTRYQ